jgi:RNA 2',3'-cyclic 3'-phosphodiesterase
MKRCFIALKISDAARAAIEALQGDLAELELGSKEKLRLTKPPNLHLTVKFLGATADRQVEDLTAALELVAAQQRSVRAELLGVGAFPNAARPRSIFAAVGPGRERLVALAESVEQVVADLGFERDERPRVPHVTLARAEDARPRGALSDFIERQAGRPFGPVDGGALVLYESKLQPGGSVYTPLAAVPLSG